MTCDRCLKPRGTEADHCAYEAHLESADADPGAPLPDGWPDPEGNHLCWAEYGGECRPPEWWDSVTPAEVHRLRVALDEARSALDEIRTVLGWPEASPRALAGHVRHVVDVCGVARAELREARAEIAAYQGRPEGALPGWERLPGHGCWRRKLHSDDPVAMLEVSEPAGTTSFWSVWLDWELVETGEAGSPRAAMRAAEAEARRRGWLPEEVTDAR